MPRSEGPLSPSVDYTVTKSNRTPPDGSYLQDLAKQLLRVEDGQETTVIFSYATKIPLTFDAANPPSPLLPNSRETMALESFYKRESGRNCAIKIVNDKKDGLHFCPAVSNGFRDIMLHNLQIHNRCCHYFCLSGRCMIPFDKISNAKRHMEEKHSKIAIERKRKKEEKTKAEMDKHVSAAEETARLRNEKKGKVTKLRSRGTTKAQRKSSCKSSVSAKSKAIPVTRNTPVKTAVLGLRSTVSQDSAEGVVTITVTPTRSSPPDIERLHSENLAGGTFTGSVKRPEHKEWVSVTGLLDMSYTPSKVNYKFNKLE